MEAAANVEVSKMETHLGYLGVIAGIAPMLGFIGTILGIIKIFYTISLTDNISIGVISGGLYEKMITSGSGLVVGVIAYFGYHMLSQMIQRYLLRLEVTLMDFMDILSEPIK
jgi:biopolymer transport protein ExbB